VKLYSIQDVWAAEARAEETVAVPRAVRDAIEKALEDGAAEGATLATRNRARALMAPRVPRAVADRVVAFFASIEKAEPDDPAFALHGGDAGRAWAASFAKALEPVKREPDANDEHEDLRRRLGLLLGAHGDEGVPLAHLASHVQKHGHKAVARALRDLGADHHEGRVTRNKPKPEPEKAKPKRAKKKPTAPPARVEKAIATPASAPAWRTVRFRGLA
jgi:hypothetical protein